MYINHNTKQEDMTANASKYPQGFFKIKKCRECSTEFQPNAPSHMYCSQDCQDKAFTRAYLKRNYKITLEMWYDLFDKQCSLCAICKEPGFKIDPNSKNLLVVDHCHTTGRVRGLLCHNCNRALGLFKDDKERLLKAVEYLNN
jgi:hypothetical protein